MAELSCCGMNFKNEEELTRHQVKAHGQQKTAVGSCCGVQYYTDSGLKEHMRVAHGKAS
jgi:Zinc finger, C2H2 type